jgi:uncharacterized LabA/DUF88 family protein
MQDMRLAVLIDADNVPYGRVRQMMEELSRYGNLTVKRIYADWTKPHVSGWKSILLENGLTPVQQYNYTTGKNATDSAMIIDAMDILFTGHVDGFCLVSSDSDFTRLATRLREAGMFVIGMGMRKTPVPFIMACEKFIYTEILDGPGDQTRRKNSRQPLKPDRNLLRLIRHTIADASDESGWAFLGDVGTGILKRRPDFDPRNYGYAHLADLMRSMSFVKLDAESNGKNGKLVFAKVR